MIKKIIICLSLAFSASAAAAESQTSAADMMAALNAACNRVSQFPGTSGLAEEMRQICVNGKATETALRLAKHAYEGVGDASIYVPYQIRSDDSESEMWITGAQRYPESLAQVLRASDKAILTNIEEGDVMSKMDVLKVLPAAEPGYRACYQLQQVLTTQLVLMSFASTIIRKDCIVSLSEQPGIAVMFSYLDPSAKNPDNRVMNQFNLLVENHGSTYLLTSSHMATVNYHFPSVVEGRMRASVPILARAFYTGIMHGPKAEAAAKP